VTDARPGAYRVVIRRLMPVQGEDAAMLQLQGGLPSLLPPRYSDPHRTGLTAVLERGKQTRDFSLRSRP